ncbi:MAG: hypothetical protein QM451_02475 [Bacillota bacterium]|jgi:hypothetical protein|nr:hypothetical protein [Bacillota bacterium]HHT91160.1 hypothetical protein [Bacillota bacterium]
MNWQQLLSQARIRWQRFMYGRNGADQLTVFVLTIAVFMALIAGVFRLPYLQLIYYAGVFWALYRTLSRSLVKRRLENQFFLHQTRKMASWFRIQRRIVGDWGTHRHFKCPNCKQRLRVPKGKGKIKITCSRCGEQFSRRS